MPSIIACSVFLSKYTIPGGMLEALIISQCVTYIHTRLQTSTLHSVVLAGTGRVQSVLEKESVYCLLDGIVEPLMKSPALGCHVMCTTTRSVVATPCRENGVYIFIIITH